MTTDQFRDAIAVAIARQWGSPQPIHRDYEEARAALAARCDWIACPTCNGERFVGCFANGWDPAHHSCQRPCPDCDGTGHPTVAQVLAWGEAVATAQHDPETWNDYGEGRNDMLDELRAKEGRL